MAKNLLLLSVLEDVVGAAGEGKRVCLTQLLVFSLSASLRDAPVRFHLCHLSIPFQIQP